MRVQMGCNCGRYLINQDSRAVNIIVRSIGYKAQLIHNEAVKDVDCAQITGDEMWSFVKKAHRLR